MEIGQTSEVFEIAQTGVVCRKHLVVPIQPAIDDLEEDGEIFCDVVEMVHVLQRLGK